MAHKLLFLLLFILPVGAMAQSDSPHVILENGKTWVYDYHHFEENEGVPATEQVYPVRYTIMGDTLIGGKSYFKMYQKANNHKKYYAAYREDGLKVFAHFPFSEEDFIVVDFEYKGLYNPDGYKENDPYSAIKEYIDYIEVDGVQYKRHTYYEDDIEDKLVIGVEGIGYTKYGLNYPSIYGPEPDCLCDYEFFTSCELNERCIFTDADFTRTATLIQHPNSIDSGKEGPQTYYSLAGQQHPTLQRGINIVRTAEGKAKKVIVK